jgi:ectoine hydroxylase-related dioxygenase (phytanoyl-CoA dioxygenase family)
VLERQLAPALVHACRDNFWPHLLDYLSTHGDQPNRGSNRHYIRMPFDPPSFSPAFFFDETVLAIVRGAMDDRVVADQWGCDVPVLGSVYQDFHVDYQRPLFPESPDLKLPTYILVVSFGLVPVGRENGATEIVPGSHRLGRGEALRPPRPITLQIGDVLIRHPWALHRGSPNTTAGPRPVVSIRYVRRWYTDGSREIASIPRSVWESLSVEQRAVMRFPLGS